VVFINLPIATLKHDTAYRAITLLKEGSQLLMQRGRS